MAGRHPATIVVAATTLTLALTACAAGSTPPHASNTRSDAAASTPAAGTPSAATTPSSATAAPVQPDADSPALTAFTFGQVSAALTLAQRAAIAGLTDTTLVKRTPHPAPDFAATEQFLTPYAKTIFEGFFDKAKGADGDAASAQNVFAYAFFQTEKSEFDPDEPITIASTNVTASPNVTTDTSPSGTTRMVITGSVSVGYVGTDTSKGGHGIMLITRTYTYSVVPTSTGSTDIAIDGWRTDTHYADSIEPVPGS